MSKCGERWLLRSSPNDWGLGVIVLTYGYVAWITPSLCVCNAHSRHRLLLILLWLLQLWCALHMIDTDNAWIAGDTQLQTWSRALLQLSLGSAKRETMSSSSFRFAFVHGHPNSFTTCCQWVNYSKVIDSFARRERVQRKCLQRFIKLEIFLSNRDKWNLNLGGHSYIWNMFLYSFFVSVCRIRFPPE